MAGRDQIREAGIIAYLLYGISVPLGPVIFLGIIYAYAKRDGVQGTYAESHMVWLIRTFWLTLAATIIGVVTYVFLIGIVILGMTWLWFVYRVVKGFVIFNDGNPIADARSWF